MTPKTIIAALVCATTLGACATSSQINRAMSYDSTVNRVETPDGIYRVFDHPRDNAVMVVTNNTRSAVAGATMGIAGIPTMEQYEAAARIHMDNTGRANCTIVESKLLAVPQVQVFYDC